MKRVLVTGATGFIGRHVLPHLARRDYEVHAAARRTPEKPDAAAGVTWHACDLLDAGALEKLVARTEASHLLHFAWYAEHKRFWNATENLAWVEATLRLLRLFSAAGGRRAVFAGSCAEYDLTCGYCSEHQTPLRPATLYGTAKDAAGRTAVASAEALGISVAWGRIFFVYGPGEHPERLVSSVIGHLMRGEPAPCTEGSQIRDFLHCADVASAFAELVDSDVEGAVNIGSGSPISVRTITTHIGELLGRPDLLEYGALTASAKDPPFVVADVSRLTNEVGWQPTLSLDTGLRLTIAECSMVAE